MCGRRASRFSFIFSSAILQRTCKLNFRAFRASYSLVIGVGIFAYVAAVRIQNSREDIRNSTYKLFRSEQCQTCLAIDRRYLTHSTVLWGGACLHSFEQVAHWLVQSLGRVNFFQLDCVRLARNSPDAPIFGTQGTKKKKKRFGGIAWIAWLRMSAIFAKSKAEGSPCFPTQSHVTPFANPQRFCSVLFLLTASTRFTLAFSFSSAPYRFSCAPSVRSVAARVSTARMWPDCENTRPSGRFL